MSRDLPLLGGGNAAFAATGSSQATAAALPADETLVTTVPAGSGVIIPLGNAGEWCWIGNGHATNALIVYPPLTGAINGYTVNKGVTLAPNTAMLYKLINPTTVLAVFGGN